MTSMLKPAIFLDRDGVIIENRAHYVRSWQDVEFLPGAIQALAGLAQTGFFIIIVTNQSAVGRGIITQAEAEEINKNMIGIIREHGGRIDGLFMCPHAPEEQCSCRKPRPGLIHQAASELSIDLESSVMIGDALTDLEAGSRAGITDRILLRTGRGDDQVRLAESDQHKPFRVFDSLLHAADWLVNQSVT